VKVPSVVDARAGRRRGTAGIIGGLPDSVGFGGLPMQKQAWGDEFGMCVDQFGVPWLVNISQPQS